jgi:hypothetical protein
MRTVETTRGIGRATALWLLVGCLCACGKTAPHDASIAVAAVARPTSGTPQAPAPAASAAKAALEIAAENEAVLRAAREQTIRVQKHLREQQRALQAAQSGNGNERCLAGQKMRRVANGWVQAGTC